MKPQGKRSGKNPHNEFSAASYDLRVKPEIWQRQAEKGQNVCMYN